MDNYDKIRQKITEENSFAPGRDLSKLQDDRTAFNAGRVPIWAHTTIKDFEACKYRVYLSKVMKAPYVSSRAADRGNRVHDDSEKYVKGELENISKEMSSFTMGFNKLKRLYDTGVVQLEENWGFTRDWDSCTWKASELWGRVKLDALVLEDDSAYVIDYKTGKKKGNEIKHTDQGITYAISTIMKYPEVQEVQAEFWYLDEKEKLIKRYSRDQLLYLVPNFERRAHALTSCMEFPPSPSVSNCRFCRHRETDSCDYAEGL